MRLPLAALTGLMTVLALAPAAAHAAPSTTLATVTSAGGGLNGGATDSTMTPDGRYVVFATGASLDPRDVNGTANDIYRRDRRTGEVILISVPIPALGGFDKSSSHPSISDDGNRVAFESLSENLVPGDTNGGSDVFVRDVKAQTTTIADVRTDGTLAGPSELSNDDVMQPEISGDGTVVVYYAADFTMTSSGSNAFHLFARQLDRPGSERIDGLANGNAANGSPSNAPPSISRDGTLVAFSSNATNLVGDDTNNRYDVFVRNRALQTTQRASVNSSGGQVAGADSDRPVLSADGSVVAFDSFATNLVTGDTNAATDVFVRDLRFGQTSRASVFANGAEAPTGGNTPAVSPTGRYVAFRTTSALITGDTGGNDDVYVADRDTGALSRASVLSNGGNALGASGPPVAVGTTGRFVLFESTNPFIAGDGNGSNDAYLRDNGLDTAPVAVPKIEAQPTGLDVVVDATASTDADGWVEQASWSFGDGTTANGLRGPHAYAAPGRYSVVLTVTDNDGATSTTTAAVQVSATPPPATPQDPGSPGPSVPPPPTTTPPKAKAPRNLARPAISVDKRDKTLLLCSAGRWEGKPTFAYRWLRDGKAIKKATKATHKIARADGGHRLSCRVTATIKGRPSGTATSRVRSIARKAHR